MGTLLRLLIRFGPMILRFIQSRKKAGGARPTGGGRLDPATVPTAEKPTAPRGEGRDDGLNARQRADLRDGRGQPTPRQGRGVGDGGIALLDRARRSDEIVEGEGVVVHVLPDDLEGDRHQRLLVEATAHDGTVTTIKISHNIDLADRVPADRGDRVRFKGEYEWNEKGGCVHWTHHDPRGWHEDGWVEANGVRVG